MGFFSGIKEADVSYGGKYILPGSYLLEIVRCKRGMTRKKTPFVVAEVKILESDNPLRPVGSECSWYVDLTKDAAMGNVKGFLASTTGLAEDDVDEAGAEEAFSEDNPLQGMQVRADAFQIKTRAGGDFTKVLWSAATAPAKKAAAGGR